MRRAATLIPALLFGLWAHAAGAVSCQSVRYEDNRYTLCSVAPATEELRLFLNDASGTPYGYFSSVETALIEEGKRLVFATNGGMYHEDRSPVGHYIEDGQEIMRVIPNAGPGNFGLLPNGVLCITDSRADVIETGRYIAESPQCRFASQSGPMLVIDGALHPKFLADSTSRYIRNGVGTSADGQTAVFVISDNAVTFHEFGTFFRDGLGLPQALFLDGSVSRLHAPDIGRSDLGRAMGPMVGVAEPVN